MNTLGECINSIIDNVNGPMFQYIAFFEGQMAGFAQAIADLARQNFD